MSVLKLTYALYKMKLLHPLAIFKLIASVYKYGINLSALLSFAADTYGNKTALVDDYESISYEQLLSEAQKLSIILQKKYGVRNGKAGFLCKNHISLVRYIFALSILGCDIYLLNAEMSSRQFNKLMNTYDFDLIVYDFEMINLIEQSNYNKDKILISHDKLAAYNLLSEDISEKVKPRRQRTGQLVILTGGTTGNFKAAEHKPSLFNYLNPFLAMLIRLKLLNYKAAYIATPIYHGYGAAVLLLFLALGKKIIISRVFNAEKACCIIREHNIEVLTAVPLMIYKMLKYNPEDLKSLRCVACGGSVINASLVSEVFEKLGDILYNLYGTSETGLNIIASPKDLRHSPGTIGRKIKGMKLKVLDDKFREVKDGNIGQFYIKNRWSMKNSTDSWIATGDLGYRDSSGYYYLCGRVDDMIVSAGENVYPIEVENILLTHPCVEDAAVIGIYDEQFGQRLKAFVVTVKSSSITEEELFLWLRPRVARYQMPKEIIFIDNMPYTPLGKLDRKRLK